MTSHAPMSPKRHNDYSLGIGLGSSPSMLNNPTISPFNHNSIRTMFPFGSGTAANKVEKLLNEQQKVRSESSLDESSSHRSKSRSPPPHINSELRGFLAPNELNSNLYNISNGLNRLKKTNSDLLNTTSQLNAVSKKLLQQGETESAEQRALTAELNRVNEYYQQQLAQLRANYEILLEKAVLHEEQNTPITNNTHNMITSLPTRSRHGSYSSPSTQPSRLGPNRGHYDSPLASHIKVQDYINSESPSNRNSRIRPRSTISPYRELASVHNNQRFSTIPSSSPHSIHSAHSDVSPSLRKVKPLSRTRETLDLRRRSVHESIQDTNYDESFEQERVRSLNETFNSLNNFNNAHINTIPHLVDLIRTSTLDPHMNANLSNILLQSEDLINNGDYQQNEDFSQRCDALLVSLKEVVRSFI